MSTTTSDLFNRDEVLAGLPARRAQTVLFLIESRTARLAAQARQAVEPFLGEITADERSLAFVEAFALGKEPPLRPRIQDLEQYVAAWRDLVPATPRIRAALAHFLGRKYQFRAAEVPGIRAALGLDEAAVEQAYAQLYGQPLATIYAARPTLVGSARWAWASLGRWFENLPPFWTSFALTFTETVGAGILALPIALAGLGPLPGVVVLIVLGLVNVLTIAAEAEAVTRSGVVRYGHAFLGRMVGDYLGATSARIIAVGGAALCALFLLAYYVGFATTLTSMVGLPPMLWTGVLFLVLLYFLRRESLSATVTTALVVGAINLIVLFCISLLAFSRLQPEYLLYVDVPWLNGQPLDMDILRLIFGVVLGAYFGHLSVGHCAPLVLHRDPSGRSLIWGAMAAQVVALIFYSLWVLAINSAIAPQVMAHEVGTALVPLATAIGPSIRILGTIYAVLGIAMASVHMALALFHLAHERMPRQSEMVVRLPRRRGQLILHPRTGEATATITLTYLGLMAEGTTPRPRFRLDMQQDGTPQRLEITPASRWDEAALRASLPHLDPRLRLTLTVQEATQDGVRLQISTPLAVRYEGEWDTSGLHMTDLLDLPTSVQSMITWLVRRGEATAAEMAAYTGRDEATTRQVLADMVEQGILVESSEAGVSRYRPQFAYRRGRTLSADIWRALDKENAPAPSGIGTTSFLARLGPRARFWLAASPTVILFLIAEVLLWTGEASFAEPLDFVGVAIASLLAGVFPALLLVAGRRKGEFVPEVVYRALGRPWVVGGFYLFFLAVIFLHGLVIWEKPIMQIPALLIGLLMIGTTVAMARRGVFTGRVVVEIREEPGADPAGCTRRFAITALGRPLAATVHLGYAAGEQTLTAATGVASQVTDLRQIVCDLPAIAARDLKVWVHRVTPAGVSESLPAIVEVRCGEVAHRADLRATSGQAIFPLTGSGCRVLVRFATLGGTTKDE
jgi:amino acid permease